MRRVLWVLFLCVFLVTFVAAPRHETGCSCSSPPPAAGDSDTYQPSAGLEILARRDAPPLRTPDAPPPKVQPMVVKDDSSGTSFNFETDGQTVTAIDKDGHVVWHKNLAEEAGIKGYSKDGQVSWPTIIQVSRYRDSGRTANYLSILFNTKDFGLVDKRTGAFQSHGRD
jgi:hypothetical protein